MHHPPFACVIFLFHSSDLSFPMLDVISYDSQFLSHYCLSKSDYLHHANLTYLLWSQTANLYVLLSNFHCSISHWPVLL
jgi:hypothetical protein